MKGFLRRWSGGEVRDAVKPWLPVGQRVYCIGDIHGRLDLLDALHAQVLEDSRSFTGAKQAVYLGDYIDRGEQSSEVIDRLLEAPLPGFDCTYLLGNHEQALLDFLADPVATAGWLSYGGIATLASYRVAGSARREDLVRLRDGLEERLPRAHLEFYSSLQPAHVAGNFCFVHAGIRPGVPLPRQSIDDLLWIREEFTESTARHEHIVVHGHTIVAEVEWRPNRIGIDTGAFHTGVLTCLVIEEGGLRLLQTGPGVPG